MDLPVEILDNIFSYLSQRYLYHCSLVCYRWYLAARTPLYKRVHISTGTQLHYFIDAAQTCHINSYAGDLVDYIHFELNQCLNIIDDSVWDELQRVCPNIRVVECNNQELFSGGMTRKEFTPWWRNLTALPYWHNDSLEQWYPFLGNKLTLLEMPHFALGPRMSDDVYRMVPLPQLNMLTQLDIDNPFIESVELDGNYFNSLQASCPNLATLTLTNIPFFPPHKKDTNHGDVTPVTSLTSLNIAYYHNYSLAFFYDYLTCLFPNVQSLGLQLPLSPDRFQTKDSKDDNRTQLYDMLTKLKHLHSLDLELICDDENILLDILPTGKMMMDWLTSRSQRLKAITWPLPCLADKDIRWLSFASNHVTCLDLTLDDSFTCVDVLECLLGSIDGERHRKTELPTQLETLRMGYHHLDRHRNAQDIFYYGDWIKVSPRLKLLHLYNLTIRKQREAVEDHIIHQGQQHQRQRRVPRLKEFLVQKCIIEVRNGLTELIRHFPCLIGLKYVEVEFYSKYDQASSKKMEILDASHLKLDYLSLADVRVVHGLEHIHPMPIRIYHLVEGITEGESGNYIGNGDDVPESRHPSILILSQAVDKLVFKSCS